MRELALVISERGLTLKSVADSGLWKRLVFQHAAEELPHRDIEERLSPAAAFAGTKLDLVTLTAWLSSHRIPDELEDYIFEQGGLRF